MLTGTISSLSPSFGFIAAEPRNIFFASNAVEWVSFGELAEGQIVEYELNEGPLPLRFGYCGGPQAASVRPIFADDTPMETSEGDMVRE